MPKLDIAEHDLDTWSLQLQKGYSGNERRKLLHLVLRMKESKRRNPPNLGRMITYDFAVSKFPKRLSMVAKNWMC